LCKCADAPKSFLGVDDLREVRLATYNEGSQSITSCQQESSERDAQIQETRYEPPLREAYSEEAALNVIRELLSIPASRSGQEISQMLDCRRKYSAWEGSYRLIDVIRKGYVPSQLSKYGITVACMEKTEQFQAQAELSRAIDAVNWDEIDNLPIPLDPCWFSSSSETSSSDGDGGNDSGGDEYINLAKHRRYLSRAEIGMLRMPHLSKFRAKIPSNLRFSLTRRDD
jgi:hypothetical protein